VFSLPRLSRGRPDAALRALRARWRTASLAVGWPFPSDWALPEVDEVCQAVVDRANVEPALAALAMARAEGGIGLTEVLKDLAALHAVVEGPAARDGIVAADPDAVPARLLRVSALAWADVAARRLAHCEVVDSLTGLATAAYLRTRLREVYRGRPAERVLVVVSPDLSRAEGWSRLVAMVLVADVLHGVFDEGETLAAVGASTAVVLAKRDERLAARVELARRLVAARLAVDPQLADATPVEITVERLPETHEEACDLLAELP